MFESRGLGEIVGINKALQKDNSIRELKNLLSEQVEDDVPAKEIIAPVQDMAKKNCIEEHEVVITVSLVTRICQMTMLLSTNVLCAMRIPTRVAYCAIHIVVRNSHCSAQSKL